MRFKALVLALALTSINLVAATPQTLVSVTVKDKYDKPVDNAEVILDFLGSRQITKLGRKRNTHWEVRTNQNGSAHFPPVPQGTFQLQVVAKHLQTFGDKFDVNEEKKNIDITLNPPQKQYSAHEGADASQPPK